MKNVQKESGRKKKSLSKQLLEDLFLYGECIYKINKSGKISRINPITGKENGKEEESK